MKDFTFDLQRFADVCSLNGTAYSSLAAAYAVAQDGDTITLLQDASGNGFEISKNITVDLGGYTYTLTYPADNTLTRAFTSSTGANYTFKHGTLISLGSNGCINNSGTLTLEDINIASTTRANVLTSGNTAINYIKGDSSVVARIGKYTLDNGLVITSVNNSRSYSPTITTQKSDNSAVVTFPTANTSNRYYFTVSEPGSKEVTYSPNVKVTGSASTDPALTVAYDSSGNPSIRNLGSGLVFTVNTNSTSGSTSVQYTVTDGGLHATSGGITKVLQGVSVNPNDPIAMTYLDFDDSNSYMVPAIFASSGVLTVSASDLANLSTETEFLIVEDGDYTKNYGYLTKVNDTTFELTKNGNTSTLSSIVINDALTAQISADFRNIPITAYVSNRIATSLTSSSSTPFTLTSDTNALVSLQGNNLNVSLTGGSIKTANTDTTIRAGGNTIQYTGGVDGVNVIASSGNVTINDIDENESFNVGSNSYWRESAGLRTGTTGVFTSDVATIYSTADKSSLIAVDLASLRSSVGAFAQPENGVLEIGKNNIGNLVIVDDKSDPTIKYAELKSSVAGNYNLTLTADSNAESFRNAVDTISLAGGTAATINKNFVYGSSKTVTLAAGAGSTPDATFKVTEVSGDTFVVTLKTSSAETIITGATGITLLSGTINAKRGQTITLGDDGRKFYVTTSSAGMNVTFDNGTATIIAAAGDTFTIDGQSFTVDSNSDGMTFTVTADNIIANDLGTADGDAFTYGGATYSVRGTGFIRTVGENQSLWSDIDSSGEYTGNHSLTGGTVTIESLPANDDHVWDAVATVRASDNSATLPPSNTSTKVTLIGNDFKETYGIFTKSGTGCTLTTGSGTNEAKLSKISVGSGVDSFEFGAGLDSITINSAVASLMVTEDDDDGYYVTLIGSSTDNKTPAILDGISRVSLISGSLRSDSAFTTNVLDKGIVAIDQSVTLTSDTSDASINGLEVGHRFSVEGGDDFNMSEVGLVNKDGRYLLGTRAGNPIIFSELDSDTPWGGLIDDDAITINATTTTALIVDNTVSPASLYGDYTNINGTQSLRAANSADAWPDVTIYISDTTVNFTSYFEDKKIQGVSSGAAFIVEDGVAFSVQDVRTGAVIGSATNISQTAGTISLASGQVIHSDAGSISADTGNLTFTVNDTAGTIGALDNADVFSLSAGSSGNIEYTRNNVGIVTNDNRILTGLAVRESVTVAQLLGDNWTNTVQINSAGVLALPPTVSSDLASPWIILSNDKNSAYGTLEQTDSGFSIHRSNNAISSLESDWASSNTISLLSAQTVTLTKDYSGAWISGLRSGASVSTSDATDDFTVTDSAGGATVSGSGAVKVNQKAGVVVPWIGQTVTAADNYAIAATSNDGDIKISVSGSDAIVTNLSEGDTFTINDHSFEVLTGGVIRRDGSELRQGSASESAADLIDSWLGKLEIDATQNWVMDGDYLRNNMTADKCYIVDKANNNNVYGTIERATSGSVTTYTVSVDGANVTPFSSVTINTNIERVTFAKEHYITNAIPITAGNATFTVTDLNVDNFTVTYDGTAGVETATAVNLSSGTLKLTDAAQVVTMGTTTAAVNAGTVTVNYDGTTVTVGSMDAAGDSVKINGTYDYTYNSGNGMTIEIAGGVTTFKNLDDDSFTTPDGAVYSINANGFVKNVNGTNYMWTSSTDVSSGVTTTDLNTSSNWTQIAVVSDGDLTIDSTSTATVVLVGNTDNPAQTIYGTLNVSGSERTLTADGGKNAELNSITVNGVTVTVASDFSKVPIIPKGNSPTINISTAMTFKPEDDGQVFKVVMNGEETEYTYSVSDSNYRLSRGSEGNILTLTQNNNTYTLPGGRWVTSGGTFRINNGESITLEYGTVTSTVSCDGGDYITATGENGEWTSFGSLNADDSFSVTTSTNTTTWLVLSDGVTLGKFDTNGKINKFLHSKITDATLTYSAITNDSNYDDILTIDTAGVLDLSAQPESTLSNVVVYGLTDDGLPDPAKNIATVSYTSSGGYTLDNSGTAIGELNSISLGTVKNLTTTIYKPVTTPSTGTYTVNNASFTAADSALTLEPGTSGVTLTSGKVTLSAGDSVLTTGGTVTAASTNTSEITVEAGDDVTVGGLSVGTGFNLNGTDYEMSRLGLSYYDGSVEKLLGTASSVKISDLSGGNTILDISTTGGTLIISSSTPESAVVDKTSGTRYGTLTKTTAGVYQYSRDGGTPGSIQLNGVKAQLDATSATITTANASGTATAVFTATASGDTFTVDAKTTVPAIEGVTAINLSSGKIPAANGVHITVDGRTITNTNDSGDAMTVTFNTTTGKTTVGGLDAGDTFTIGSNSYRVTSTNELYKETSGGSGGFVTSGFSASAKTYEIDDVPPDNVLPLKDGVLDLTGSFDVGYTARVVSDSSDPTTKVGTLTKTSAGFTLSDAGDYADALTSISLPNSDTALTTTIYKPVNTARGSATYTVNAKEFTASNSALTIEPTASNAAELTSGTVSLNGNDVATPEGTIEATNGTINVNVNGSTVTISAIGNGDVFTFGEKTYIRTAIGLSDGTDILTGSITSRTTDQLSSGWQTMIEASSGVLSVNESTAAGIVVDSLTAPAINYGTLSKSGSAYTFTAGTTALSGITLSNGLNATLTTTAPVTAGNATFTAGGTFTVNATTTPTITDATSVTLQNGTINAPTSVTVTAGNYAIATSAGDMTITVNGNTVSIGGLNSGDAFTVDGKAYTYSDAGLFSGSARISNVSDGTLTLPATETAIIAPTNGTLDLSNVTTAVEVYDSATNPTTKLGDVTVSGSAMTLSGTSSAASNITTVNVARGSNWTINFETDVTATAGTVNGQAYTSTGSTLTIHSDGTNSTLTGGTVSLSAGNSVPTAKGTVAATNGTINVNVSGSTVTISAIGNGDVFTFGGKTYTRTAIGLSDGTNLIAGNVTSIETGDLDGGTTMIEATGGVLQLPTSGAGIVVDSLTAPAINYGTVNIDGDAYTFAAGTTALSGITLANGFNATLTTTTAPVTAGNATFTAGGTFTVNASTPPTIDNATSITLTSGRINAPTGVTVTAGDYSIAMQTGDGMTITVNGSDVSIGSLNDGDTFTLGKKTYTVTEAGLFNTTDKTRVTGVTGGTWNLSDDDETPIIAPSNGTLNLSTRTTAAEVYDSTSNPTTKLGDVTVSGSAMTLSGTSSAASNITTVSIGRDTNWTIDFETDVTTTAATVNGQSYMTNGGTLTIHSDGKDSTLTSGTVSLNGNDVTTPEGTIEATNGTINVNVNGSTVTISAIGNGDVFTFGEKTYIRTAIGLSDGTDILTGSITSRTTDQLSSGWQTMIEASSGVLSVNESTAAGIVVDSLTAPAINYGTLSKSGSAYTFTAGTTALSGITLSNGLNATLTTTAPVTAGNATFTAGGTFTVNATTPPTIDNATSITLTSGTINAPTSAVTVMAGDYSIAMQTGDGMTITVNGSAVSIGGLNSGDAFTVDGKAYTYGNAGLFSGSARISNVSDGTLTLPATETAIIAPTNGTLDLSNVTTAVEVYNSATNPTTKLGDVTANGSALKLSGTSSAASNITTVNVARGSNWTIDFETDVTATAGTVNGQAYISTGSTLTIHSDGTNSTLTGGTVSLSAGNSVPTAKGTIAATSGTINVNVNGSTVTISAIGNGDVFTFGGKTYTRTAIGLSDGTNLIAGNVTSIETGDLDGGTTMIEATGGVLQLPTSGAGIVVDSLTAPAINYGTVNIDGDAYTFAAGTTALSGITLANGFNATLTTTTAPVTAGNATFTAGGTFTVNASTPPTIDNATSITLTSGRINAPTGVTVTAGDYSIAMQTGDGMTITINGSDVSIGGLNDGDSFKLGKKTYTVTEAGLFNTTDKTRVTGVTGGTLTLPATETAIIAPSSGTLNLSTRTTAAEVYDSTSNPTTKLGDVTVNGSAMTLNGTSSAASNITTVNVARGSNWTIDFETDVTTTSATVNGQSYTTNGGTLTIRSDGKDSTLKDGTVSLSAGNDVPTAKGTVAAQTGTITVNVSGDTVTIGNLSNGKVFTFGGETYYVSAIGLKDGNNLRTFSGNSIDTDDLSSGWQSMIEATDGNLIINTASVAGVAVNDIDTPTINYGTLTGSGTAYTFAASGTNKLNSITVSGVTAVLDSTNAGIVIYAGDATFTVAASDNFTVDALSTPVLSNVSEVNLTDGKIKAPDDKLVIVGAYRITATEGDMSIELNDNGKTVIGDLNTGDTFTIGSSTYEMMDTGLYNSTSGYFVTEGVSEDKTTFTVDDAVAGAVLSLDENGNLDLTFQPASASYNALVVGRDQGGNVDLSRGVATVTFDGTGYTLTAGANVTDLNSISLSAVPALDILGTTKQINVTAPANGTYTVNDKIFAALSDLTIAAQNGDASLSDGTVSLAAGNSVNTPDNTIASTAGTLTVAVDGSDVTIGNLSAGKAFSVDDTDYSMTSIGLSDGNRILQTTSAVTLDELAGTDWLAILNAPNGALTVNADTASSIVVDISNPSNAVNYGTLTKAGTNYTYAQNGSNVLQSVTLDGVAATFPRSCAAATFTAGETTFSITASDDFTIDDTGSVPAISGATSITLTAGTIQPEIDIPVTVGSRKITATGGTVTVGLADGKTQIGALNVGDSFQVGGTAYVVTSAGELFDETDSMIVTSGFSGDTFTLDDATLTRIITADGTNLDLTDQTQSALVYDSDTNPTALLATLGVTGSTYTLSGTDDNIIRTVDIKTGSALNIDFNATISGSGSVEVNDVTYNGTGDLIIYADDTTSQLYSGTITLTPSVTAPEAANDSATLAVENGSVTATAVNGYYTTLGSLDSGDSFTYNGNTYTQSKFGLLQGGNICENLAGSTLTLSALDSAAWSEFLAPVANVLDLTSANVNAVVYDDYTTPAKKLADLSIVNGRKILKGASGASKAIQTVVISDGDTFTVDFSTQVSAPSATVNGTNYHGTSDLLIDARANGSSLYSGSVTINAGSSLKATNDSAAFAVSSGSVIATASQGNFISLNGVGTGDTFTFNGNNYTMTALGLLSGNTIAQELNDSFIDLTTLDDADWLTFIAPRNGTLDISNVTSNKIVFDSSSNPVNKLADLSVQGSDYSLIGTRYASDILAVHIPKDSSLTIDFAAQVTAPVGTATVNGKTFNATTALTLDATQGDATLARGSVALDNADSVSTSSGYTVTANTGNGLSVTASTSALTVGGLNAGDDFSVDGRDYSLRDIGLLRDDLIYQNSAGVLSSGSVSVDALLSDQWRQAIFIDGSLNLPVDFDSGFLLDEDLTRLYGYLTRNGRAYTLTAPTNVNAKLTDISLDAVSLIADSAFASVPLSANDSQFADVVLASGASTFTLDATDTPTFTGVASFTLEAGTVAAKAGQSVTAGSHVISGDLTVAIDGGVILSGFSDDFTLDGDTYHVAPIGLINLTDSAVVTGGLSGNTLRVEDIDFTPFIGISNGTIDLTRATENVLIYDSATDPANQIATLTVDGNKFTLNGTDAASLIQTINVAAGSDFTVDFAAQVTAPIGSVTVNGKTYNATTAVTLQSDGTTSTLTLGTVALANGGSVNTTNGNSIAATAGDGLTVNAASDSVTVSGLNSGDTFTADGNTYTVGTNNLLHDGKLWTGDTYQNGVTLDELNDDANWTDMLSATYSSVAVDGATLDDGEKAVLVDNTTDPATTYGTLSKTDGIYLLMKDDTQDDKLAAISVQGTIIDIDVELADVPITTINADESESEFTVKPSAGVETFRVDATGNSPRIYGVDEIDLIRGKVFPQDGQIIKPADGSETITLSYGNGTYTIGDKTITIGGLADGETVDIEINGDGNINSVYNIPKDAYVIYDGVTYTAPFDDARLSFEEEPCYFDGYTLPAYNVVIDPDGNIKVDTGIQFGKVVTNGKTLGDDGTIQIAGDGSAVKITNESDIPLKVVDNGGDTLAENLNADDGVTFSDAGVSADDLQAVAGATVYLDDGQSLTAGDETTVAAQGDATVGVGTDGDSISVDGSAVIDAPADTELTLGEAPYTVKGANFETSGTAQATVTSDGVEVDLGISDAITHDDMTLTGGESSTAEINGDGDVTLTSGATAANATDKPVTVDGTVQLDDKTVKASEPVEVTEKTNGLQVGDTELTVGGDSAGYQVNIDGGDISGLENIGSGATIGGLSDATIKTNEEGSITVGDKTFTTTGDSAVTYGLSEGAITSISDLDGILAGDFSEGVTVNGDPLTVDSSLKGAVAIAADEDGVSAIQTGDADTYTINGHAYETSGDATFGMSNASVTGVTTDDGTFAIGQDETDFQVNGETLTLSRNTNPVTLGISDGSISSVFGVDGAIGGLSNAKVYDLTKATVNGKVFDVSGTTFDAIVSDGTVSSIVGLSAPATVNTAPEVSIVTSTDGDFRVGGRDYTIDDTVDGSVTFTTDTNSRLTGINDFAGSLNGAVTSVTLNGKAFGTNNPAVTVSSDGRNITAIDGLKSGDSIGGDIDSATFHMPEGNLTINGGVYTLEDDADGATASRGGKTFVGVEKDASLTVGADGSHRVNGGGGRASVGSVFTVNRDGGYMINPDYLPIIEKTPAGDIRARSDGTLALQETSGTVGAGNDTVVVRRNAEVTADASGESLIIATSGNVTLENYTAGNASIGSFEYTNLANAIKTNAIQFGDGTMTLGDAVITFNANAGSTGATQAQLVNAQGKEQAIGFTHTNGGTVNASGATVAQVLKGNYAEKSSDTQKSGGSNVVGGSGNDTLLVGAGDTVNGGAGDDHIYITDGAFRELGALIVMSAGSDVVHNFNGGYSTASDTIRITDLNALEYEAAANLVLTSGTRQLTFDGFSASSADLVTSTDLAESADTATASDGSYRLKLSDGNGNYNAAIARGGRNIYVTDGDLANVFFGTNSGVNFSEYTGAVSVNLDTGTGNVGTSSAQFKGINQLTGGAGSSSLTGASEVSNTLTAGLGGGQIWSNSGNDLMIGQSGKSSATTFRYLAEDGQDTISGFGFATSADAAGDLIDITTANEVTTVSLSGGNVILYINGSDTDYLTLAQGKGNDFRINNLVAQVDDRQLAFDGLANCYVANGSNATLTVDASVESAEIWLNDMKGGLHGTYYLGDITVVDGSRSAGQLILTGNALDNTIIGGAGTNSIWGGYGCDNDVMIGGAGQNTFFFALVNGNDVIQGAHDGDVIDLTTVKTTDIAGTQITDSGTAIGLWDGSVLEVRGNAAVEYKTADGTYIADHASGQWVKTK